MKGLLVEIFRPQYGDCSNGGVSSVCSEVVLVGEGIPELFVASAKTPAVRIVKRMLPPKGVSWCSPADRVEYLHAEPVEGKDEGRAGWMFGGTCIYTSDSRFPSSYPIKLHDRQE